VSTPIFAFIKKMIFFALDAYGCVNAPTAIVFFQELNDIIDDLLAPLGSIRFANHGIALDLRVTCEAPFVNEVFKVFKVIVGAVHGEFDCRHADIVSENPPSVNILFEKCPI
jgi:hypothetical protein